jgi:hypothetical protein
MRIARSGLVLCVSAIACIPGPGDVAVVDSTDRVSGIRNVQVPSARVAWDVGSAVHVGVDMALRGETRADHALLLVTIAMAGVQPITDRPLFLLVDGQRSESRLGGGRFVGASHRLFSTALSADDFERICAAAKVEGSVDGITFEIPPILREKWTEAGRRAGLISAPTPPTAPRASARP